MNTSTIAIAVTIIALTTTIFFSRTVRVGVFVCVSCLANVNSEHKELGGTALVFAARFGYARLVSVLLMHPLIDVNKRIVRLLLRTNNARRN